MLPVKEAIEVRGMNIVDLARDAGITRTAMSRIVNHGQWLKRKKALDIISAVRMRFADMKEEDYMNLWGIVSKQAKILEECDALQEEVVMLSQAAKQKFNIVSDPFVDDVRESADVYVSKEHKYIRESMYQTAKHGGFLAVVGESGSGKSTLRRDLISRIVDEKLSIVVIQPKSIDKTRLNASSIMEAIMADVAPTVRVKRSLEAKARQIEQVLTHSSRSGKKHVLIIEEAHDLHVRTMKYLKRFWELEDGFTKLLSIILIGQPEMRYQLDEGRNYDAREVIRRIEVATLQPLEKPGQIEDYMKLKFRRIGVDWNDIADKDVGAALRDKMQRQTINQRVYSTAYPLSLNNIVKRALNEAADLGAERIDNAIIEAI